MAEPTRYILDASVAVKWCLRDEDHTDTAIQVRTDYQHGAIDLIAPAHLPYEVSSAVRRAFSMRRITQTHASNLIRLVTEWGIPLVEPDFVEAFEVSATLSCSYYDAFYVSLAQASGLPLLTADRKLVNAIGQRFQRLVWIEDYGSPTT
jgi:predicted nucleic acid-binding protein